MGANLPTGRRGKGPGTTLKANESPILKFLWLIMTIPHIVSLDGPRYFSKRGRYSDPGSRGRDVGETLSPKQRLESLITRLGEKVAKHSLVNQLLV